MICYQKLFLSLALLALAGCSSTPSNEDSTQAQNEGMFSSEVKGKPKKATAVDIAIEKETAKEDVKVTNDRFKNAYGSNREENIIAAGSELLSKNPNDVTALKAIGAFYVRQNKPGIAKMYFDRALEKDPRNADVNNMLGVLALQDGKEQEAQRYFKLAIQGDDEHVEANFNLGTYYLKYLDYQKAEKFLEVAYDENKRDAAIANNYAIALRGMGNIDKALSVYKGIDGRGSKVPSLLNQAILLAEYKKDYKEAREVLNKIKFISTDPTVLRKVNEITKIVDQK